METTVDKVSDQNLSESDREDFFQYKAYNSGLRALMSIRNFSSELAKDYAQLIKMEKQLDQMNGNATLVVEEYGDAKGKEMWKNGLVAIQLDVVSVNQLLTKAGERASNKTAGDSVELWSRFDEHLSHLKEAYSKLSDAAIAVLPESEHLHWNKEVFNLPDSVLPLLVAHVELCKLKLLLLEKYTPDELASINKMIQDHIPDDYSYQEAIEYRKEYLTAMVDFTKEFQEKKNLWDKFLDVLAGGTHQSPSERIMFDKWIEGEKGAL
jgi:hypothetical protein